MPKATLATRSNFGPVVAAPRFSPSYIPMPAVTDWPGHTGFGCVSMAMWRVLWSFPHHSGMHRALIPLLRYPAFAPFPLTLRTTHLHLRFTSCPAGPQPGATRRPRLAPQRSHRTATPSRPAGSGFHGQGSQVDQKHKRSTGGGENGCREPSTKLRQAPPVRRRPGHRRDVPCGRTPLGVLTVGPTPYPPTGGDYTGRVGSRTSDWQWFSEPLRLYRRGAPRPRHAANPLWGPTSRG